MAVAETATAGTRVHRFGAGAAPAYTTPGDFILTHRRAKYSRIVTFGQRRRFKGEDRHYAHWSHAALVSGHKGEIIQAVSEGVEPSTLDEYRDVEYHYIHTGMNAQDRTQAVRFAESCQEQKYAWAAVSSLALAQLTGTRFQFGMDQTMFCSELVVRALERGDFIFPKSPNTMMPADLAQYFQVTSG